MTGKAEGNKSVTGMEEERASPRVGRFAWPQDAWSWAGWVAFIVAGILYYPRAAKTLVNLSVYVKGAECYFGGHAMLDCVPAFTYPPAVALAALPLVPLSPATRMIVWYVFSLVALLACIAMCEALARRLYPAVAEPTNFAILRIGTFLLSLKFVLVVLSYQSYDLLVLALILAGLLALANGRDVTGAAALAIAAACKATPLIFLPWLLLKRRFVAAAVLVAGVALLSLLPDIVSAARGLRGDYFISWIGQVAGPALTPGGSSNLHFWQGWMSSLDNLSLRGVLNRLAPGPVAGLHPRIILGLAFVATGSVIAWLILRSPRRAALVGVDGAVLMIGMLALSPISSRYHFILLMLPYAMVIAAALCERSLRTLALWTLAASFILVTGTSNDLTGQTLAEFAHGFGFMLIGTLILLIPLAAIVRRERARSLSSVMT